MSEYLKTKAMATILGYHKDYLLKNRGVLFFQGKHYFENGKHINWKVSQMKEWIEGNNMSIEAQEILDLVS